MMNKKAAVYIASKKESESISGIITLSIPIYRLLNKLWTSLSLTQ